MPTRTLPVLAYVRRHAAALVVALIAVATTLAAAVFVARTVDAQQAARFREETSASTATLRDRLDAYVAMLRAARGFVDGLGRPPTAHEWHLFAVSLDLARQFPGVRGLGWAVALRPGEVQAHVAAQRAAGRPDYRVWPEGDRPLYSAVVHVEPLDSRNRLAIGFDMLSDPVRRAAMQRTDADGEPAATGKVELVQEAGAVRQAGFLVYVAVNEEPADPDSSVVGWVYAPVRAADLIHRALGDHRATVGFAVFDGVDPTSRLLLLDEGGAGRGDRVAEHPVSVAGRTLLVRYVSRPEFATPTERLLPLAVLLIGVALSALVLWILRGEVMRRGRAERQARRTAFLAGAGRAFSASLDYRRSLGRAARFAAGRVADLCVFVVLEPEGPLWRVGARDVAFARRLEAALAAAGVDSAAAPPGRHRDRAVQLPFARATAELAALLAEAGVREAIRAPLAARGETLGAVALLAGKGRLGRADEALAEDLARAASAAIDIARLFRHAEEAVRARDEFLSIASHELKTPLTSLGLQADSLLVAARRLDAAPLAHKAEVVRRNVGRLTGLVARLLDISRISAGRLELDLSEVDLAEVAREVVEKFEDEAARSRTAVRLAAPAHLVGRWDRLRLDQVLTNLLANAIKYGPGKPVEMVIEDRLGRAHVTVRDQGIGISPEDQARIFERFERAVSRRHYGGFGLGLWIVRQLVETMGGTVRVESTPDAGATFEVELPLDQAAEPVPRPADRPAAPAP
jgi:signal transduction histidine kinase